jgi:hypothetical protein
MLAVQQQQQQQQQQLLLLLLLLLCTQDQGDKQIAWAWCTHATVLSLSFICPNMWSGK